MNAQWVLVANGSVAHFFRRSTANDPLVPLDTIRFPAARLKPSALERDRQGHESSDNSTAAAHFEPATSTRRKLMQQFAHQLADHMEQGLAERRYNTLWLVASSPFLGELKAALSKDVERHVEWVHDADLTTLPPKSLRDRLQALKAPAH